MFMNAIFSWNILYVLQLLQCRNLHDVKTIGNLSYVLQVKRKVVYIEDNSSLPGNTVLTVFIVENI